VVFTKFALYQKRSLATGYGHLGQGGHWRLVSARSGHLGHSTYC